MIGSIYFRARKFLTLVRDTFLPRPGNLFALPIMSEMTFDPITVRKTAGVLRLSELGQRHGNRKQVMGRAR